MVNSVHAKLLALFGTLAVALCCVACEGVGRDGRTFQQFRFEHEQPRNAFRERLRTEDVDFRELPDGTLVFENPRDGRISDAVRDITKEFYGYPGAFVDDKRSKDELVAILAARDIEFSVVGLDSGFGVRWKERDDAEVRAIFGEIHARRVAELQRELEPQR